MAMSTFTDYNSISSFKLYSKADAGKDLFFTKKTGATTWTPLTKLLSLEAGTSTSRPVSGISIGFTYFDTTLGKPIWWNGSGWKDANGTTV